MARIYIQIPSGVDRRQPGILRVTTDDGKIVFQAPVLARADQRNANKHENPTRDPTKQMGDSPTGTYIATGWKKHSNTGIYGPNGVIVLDPVAGEALEAKDQGKRQYIYIHGGGTDEQGALRATYGCFRLSNSAMFELLRVLATVTAAEQGYLATYALEQPFDVHVEEAVNLDGDGELGPLSQSTEPWQRAVEYLSDPRRIQSPSPLEQVLNPSDISQARPSGPGDQAELSNLSPFVRRQALPGREWRVGARGVGYQEQLRQEQERADPSPRRENSYGNAENSSRDDFASTRSDVREARALAQEQASAQQLREEQGERQERLEREKENKEELKPIRLDDIMGLVTPDADPIEFDPHVIIGDGNDIER